MMMRRGLIALAGMLTATAYGQSSVTLYGVADAGIEYLNKAPSTSTKGSSLVRLTSGNLSTSRWGIRGSEDLGGGLKASFELESGLSIDTGASNNGSKLFDRSAIVGLGNQYGTVWLGRQTTPLYDAMLQLDPMGLAPRYSSYKSDDILAGRADNAVKYRGTFGSVTASGLYSFSRTGAGEIPGDFKIDRNIGASLMYESGAISVGAAYDEFQGSSIATQNQKDRRLAVGGSYAVGPAKIFAGYRWYNGSLRTLPVDRSDLYWLGVRYSLTPAFVLTGAAYFSDNRNTNADPLMLVASGDYAFSKRTDVYMTLGYTVNRNGSQLGLNGYNTLTGNPNSVVPGKDQFGAVVGVRHRF